MKTQTDVEIEIDRFKRLTREADCQSTLERNRSIVAPENLRAGCMRWSERYSDNAKVYRVIISTLKGLQLPNN